MIISFEEICLSLGWNDLLNREIFTTLTEAKVLIPIGGRNISSSGRIARCVTSHQHPKLKCW
jgi:hypothetical protein